MYSMETILFTTAACILSGLAGYAIVREVERSKQYKRDIAHHCELAKLREQLATLREQTACACGLSAHHTGKHAPKKKK